MIKYFFLLISAISWSQYRTVIDNETNEPIPYVNVSGNKDNSYINSNKEGIFNLKDFPLSDSLTFTATGFKQLKVSKSEIKDKIMLHYDEVELGEAVIIPLKNTETIWVNRVKKANSGYACSFKKKCWMPTKFFSYKVNYKQTPYLNSLNIFTRSSIKNAKFKLRFYNVGEDGFPDEEISRENIIVTVKKGKRKTKVNLKDFKLKFPKEGLFISFEFLKIPENEKETEVTSYDDKESKNIISKEIVTFIEPRILSDSKNHEESLYFYHGEKWIKSSIFKYHETLAIELELTN